MQAPLSISRSQRIANQLKNVAGGDSVMARQAIVDLRKETPSPSLAQVICRILALKSSVATEQSLPAGMTA